MHIAHLMSDYLSLKMILYSIYWNKCEADTGWHMKSLLWGVCGLIYQNLHYKLCVCVAQATWSILSNDSSYIWGYLWICDWNCVCFKIRFWYLLNEGIFMVIWLDGGMKWEKLPKWKKSLHFTSFTSAEFILAIKIAPKRPCSSS